MRTVRFSGIPCNASGKIMPEITTFGGLEPMESSTSRNGSSRR